MRLIITEDYTEMSEWAAGYIKKRINDFKPGPNHFFVLGLPTGMFYSINYLFIFMLILR